MRTLTPRELGELLSEHFPGEIEFKGRVTLFADASASSAISHYRGVCLLRRVNHREYTIRSSEQGSNGVPAYVLNYTQSVKKKITFPAEDTARDSMIQIPISLRPDARITLEHLEQIRY